MGEAEKMEALKMAYAEIILNTAKEAAARILVSERNALRLERELSAVKEESLNMVLRVKQMMDSKCAEAESTSFSQRKRIEELEAQLNEAEDVITDIRLELKEAETELAKMKNNQAKSLNEQIISKSTASHERGKTEEDVVTDLKAQWREGQDELSKMKNSQVKLLDGRVAEVCIGSHVNASQEKILNTSDSILSKPVDSRVAKVINKNIASHEKGQTEEDVVTDLKAQRREVQDELSKMKNSQVKHLDGRVAKIHIGSHVNASQEKILNTSDSILSKPVDSGVATVINKSIASHERGQTEEDVVTDLKAQWREVQNELSKMKNSQLKPSDIRFAKVRIGSHVNASQEKILNASDSILAKLVDSEVVPQSKSDLKGASLSNRKAIDYCSFTSSPQSGFLNDSSGDICYAGNPDLASIIMRNKEPDLYINGCTQKRIRAFEGNMLNANLPLQGQINNQYQYEEEESLMREDEAAEGLCTLAPHKDDSMSLTERKRSRLETSSQQVIRSDKGQAVTFFTRFSSRKRRGRYKRTKTILSTREVKRSCETCVPSSDDTGISKEEAYIKSESHLAPLLPLNIIKDVPSSGYMNGIGTNAMITKRGSFESSSNEDTELIDKSVFISPKNRDVENSSISVCTLNPNNVCVTLVSPDSEASQKCVIVNEAPTRSINDRFLKYTFQRKRKKESLSSADENVSPERNTSNRLSGEKEKSGLEPQKSSLMIESSQESRRVMQVARQLISMSEKRWWQ